jgi:hypothetical protein
MEIEDFTTEELQEELDRRREAAHHRRQTRIYRGEREETTDGDQHIESNGGVFRGQRCGGRQS